MLLHGDVKPGDLLDVLEFDVSTTTIVAGAFASRDYSPLHHDFHYVTLEAGQRDIFLNTPTQASLFERYLTRWSGPRGRTGRMKFKMKSSVYAGDRVVVSGKVTESLVDTAGCGWVKLSLQIEAQGSRATMCDARYALPLDEVDNPWSRRGEEWQP